MNIVNDTSVPRYFLVVVLLGGCVTDPIGVLTGELPVAWVSIPGFDYGGGDVAAGSDGVLVMGGNALFRSTNSGVAWSRIAPLDYMFSAVERFDNGQFIAIGFPNNGGPSHDYVVFTSSDDGANWKQLAVLPEPRCIERDPDGRLFVGTFGGGMFRSTDAGTTWSGINEGLDVSTDGVLNYYVRDILHVEGDIVLAGTAGGIVRSTTAGNAWVSVFAGNYGVPKLLKVSGAIILATSEPGIYRSTDGGLSWSLVQSASYPRDIVQTLSGRIIAAADTGILVSDDQGASWSWRQGPDDRRNPRLCSAGPNVILAARSMVYRSTDTGESWIESNSGVATGTVVCFVRSAGTVIVNSTNGFLRSPFPPDRWQEIPGPDPYEMHVGMDMEIYALDWVGGSTQLHRSTDNGASWIPIDHSIVPTYLRSMAVGKSGVLFVGDASGKVYQSNNAGQSWDDRSSGLSLSTIKYLSLNNSGTLVAGDEDWSAAVSTDLGASWRTMGHPEESPTRLTIDESGTIWWGGIVGNLYRSTDLGITWASYPVHPGNGYNIGDVVTTANGEIVVAVANAGVYRSRDKGTRWSLISDPRIGSRVGRLYRDHEGYLYLGVGGGGAYRTVDPLP